MLYLGPLIPANHSESKATSEFIRDDLRQFAGETLNLFVTLGLRQSNG